jgi:hypothetical protein
LRWLFAWFDGLYVTFADIPQDRRLQAAK